MPQNIWRCLPPIAHIQLEVKYITVWHKQGSKAKKKPLNYYPTLEEIFIELARKSKTNITIPKAAKESNQLILEPFTDQEKEEEYEVNLHISTFTSEDSSTKEKNPLQIENVPPNQ